jgi:hypothetical protein
LQSQCDSEIEDIYESNSSSADEDTESSDEVNYGEEEVWDGVLPESLARDVSTTA